MTVRFTTLNCWQTRTFLIILIFLTACQPDSLRETSISVQSTASSLPIIPSLTAPLETTTPIIAPTPFTTSPTLTPPQSSTVVNRATTTPVLVGSPLEKVTELPVKSTNFTISPDGTLLAVVDKDTGILYVYNTTDWQLKWEIEEENRGMTGYVLDFSPDGNFLAGGGSEQDVFVWDMNTGETTYVLSEPYDAVNSVSFSPDGKLLAVSALETHSSPYRIMVWDTSTGQLSDQFYAVDYGWYIENIVFIPNQANLLALTTTNFRNPEEYEEGHKPGGLYFWNIATQQIQEAVTGTRGTALATSPNGQLVAVYIDGFLRVWNLQTQTEILNVRMDEAVESWDISLTDTGIVASLDTQWTLTVWSLEGELLATLASDKIISDIDFTLDGKLLIAYLLDNTPIEMWQIVQGAGGFSQPP